MSLPLSVKYDEELHSLPPETQNFEYVATPVNGSTFGQNQQIIIDLGNKGFLDPASLYFRYKMTYTGATNVAVTTLNTVGTPAYQPFVRMDCLVNSQQIESINLYNTVCNMHTNLQLDISSKLGQQYNLGYGPDSANLANENTDGGQTQLPANTTTVSVYYSAPLVSVLSFSDKLIPLFLLNNVRYVFTLDTVAHIATATAAAVIPTDYQISNFEVVYNVVDMGHSVEREIVSLPKLRIKSMSYASSTAPTVPIGQAGALTLQYNMRYASLRSAFLNCGGTSATSANGQLDSYDITAGNGDYQFSIGGIPYPSRPVSTILNKAGAMMELRRAMGTIFGSTVALSITSAEFSAVPSTATSNIRPAKFWFSQNLMKLTTPSRSLFNGVSTQLSPINVNINMNTALATQAISPSLIVLYDAVIEIDTLTRNVLMIQ